MKLTRKKWIALGSALALLCSIGFMLTSAASARERLTQNAVVTPVTPDELLQLLKQEDFADKYALIDTRTPLEYKINRIPSSINIPHYKILRDTSVLDQYNGKQLIFYCQSGVRVEKVTDLLTKLKYDNLSHLKGDIRAWKANKNPLE